jgi:hypothetical protein
MPYVNTGQAFNIEAPVPVHLKELTAAEAEWLQTEWLQKGEAEAVAKANAQAIEEAQIVEACVLSLVTATEADADDADYEELLANAKQESARYWEWEWGTQPECRDVVNGNPISNKPYWEWEWGTQPDRIKVVYGNPISNKGKDDGRVANEGGGIISIGGGKDRASASVGSGQYDAQSDESPPYSSPRHRPPPEQAYHPSSYLPEYVSKPLPPPQPYRGPSAKQSRLAQRFQETSTRRQIVTMDYGVSHAALIAASATQNPALEDTPEITELWEDCREKYTRVVRAQADERKAKAAAGDFIVAASVTGAYDYEDARIRGQAAVLRRCGNMGKWASEERGVDRVNTSSASAFISLATPEVAAAVADRTHRRRRAFSGRAEAMRGNTEMPRKKARMLNPIAAVAPGQIDAATAAAAAGLVAIDAAEAAAAVFAGAACAAAQAASSYPPCQGE